MYQDGLPPAPTQGSIIQPVYFEAIATELPAVILTPTCDVEQRKVDFVTCVGLRSFPDMQDLLSRGRWQGLLQDGETRRTTLTPNQRKALEKEFLKLYRNEINRFHWFDPWATGKEPRVADFQLVTSIGLDEFATTTTVAHLAPEFLESLPSRYVAYMGRIGTQDRAADAHSEHFAKMVARLFPAMAQVPENTEAAS